MRIRSGDRVGSIMFINALSIISKQGNDQWRVWQFGRNSGIVTLVEGGCGWKGQGIKYSSMPQYLILQVR